MNIFKHIDSLSLMKGMEKGTVDLVLTDPPYIISKPSGFKSVVNGEQRFAVSTEHGEWFLPHVVEPAFGIDRILWHVLDHAFDESEKAGEPYTVLRLKTSMRANRRPCTEF